MPEVTEMNCTRMRTATPHCMVITLVSLTHHHRYHSSSSLITRLSHSESRLSLRALGKCRELWEINLVSRSADTQAASWSDSSPVLFYCLDSPSLLSKPGLCLCKTYLLFRSQSNKQCYAEVPNQSGLACLARFPSQPLLFDRKWNSLIKKWELNSALSGSIKDWRQFIKLAPLLIRHYKLYERRIAG